MKKNVLSCIIFLVFVVFSILTISAASKNYYELNLNYDKGNLSIFSFDIIQSSDEIDNSFGENIISVMDYKNNVLDVSFFDVPDRILYDQFDENGTIVGGGEKTLNNVNFTLLIPYYYNATKIIIYDGNLTRELEIDVSLYSKTYTEYKRFTESNGILNESVENQETNEETEKNQEVEKESFLEKISKYWWVLLIVLIILVGIIVYYVTK